MNNLSFSFPGTDIATVASTVLDRNQSQCSSQQRSQTYNVNLSGQVQHNTVRSVGVTKLYLPLIDCCNSGRVRGTSLRIIVATSVAATHIATVVEETFRMGSIVAMRRIVYARLHLQAGVTLRRDSCVQFDARANTWKCGSSFSWEKTIFSWRLKIARSGRDAHWKQ